MQGWLAGMPVCAVLTVCVAFDLLRFARGHAVPSRRRSGSVTIVEPSRSFR